MRLTLESSRAFSAARGSYLRGEPIPEIVKAWAAETESTADDVIPEQVSSALLTAADYLERAAVWCVRVALRVEALVPVVTEKVDRVAHVIEDTSPKVVERVRETSRLVRENGPRAKHLASEASIRASQLAERLRSLRGDT